jgi:hypothetical protein
MWRWFKYWLNRYDNWCQQMGLTPAQRRRCVAYREETADETSDKSH